MCTYSNKTKNTCQKIVGGISLVLGLFGVITLAMGAMSGGGMPDQLVQLLPENAKAQMSGANSTAILGLGVLILATSILGCATARFKNPCFAIPFGILTFVFGLLLLIIGALAMAVGSPPAREMMMQVGCNNDANNPLRQFDNQYNEMVGKPLCSDICPCP